MPNLNRVMLMGNLTRDPQMRKTAKGTSVAEVTLAINRYFTSDDGQRRESTAFVDVTLWGRHAEIVCEWCHKGKPLYVEGRLNMDTWEDRNSGQQRSKLRVVGENIQLLGNRDGQSQSGGGGYPQSNQYDNSGSNYQSGGNNYQNQNGPLNAYQNTPPQQQNTAYQPPPQQQQPPSRPVQEGDADIPF